MRLPFFRAPERPPDVVTLRVECSRLLRRNNNSSHTDIGLDNQGCLITRENFNSSNNHKVSLWGRFLQIIGWKDSFSSCQKRLKRVLDHHTRVHTDIIQRKIQRLPGGHFISPTIGNVREALAIIETPYPSPSPRRTPTPDRPKRQAERSLITEHPERLDPVRRLENSETNKTFQSSPAYGAHSWRLLDNGHEDWHKEKPALGDLMQPLSVRGKSVRDFVQENYDTFVEKSGLRSWVKPYEHLYKGREAALALKAFTKHGAKINGHKVFDWGALVVLLHDEENPKANEEFETACEKYLQSIQTRGTEAERVHEVHGHRPWFHQSPDPEQLEKLILQNMYFDQWQALSDATIPPEPLPLHSLPPPADLLRKNSVAILQDRQVREYSNSWGSILMLLHSAGQLRLYYKLLAFLDAQDPK